jgi:hypothetical protein
MLPNSNWLFSLPTGVVHWLNSTTLLDLPLVKAQNTFFPEGQETLTPPSTVVNGMGSAYSQSIPAPAGSCHMPRDMRNINHKGYTE